jgi:hypothetical protein
MRGRAFKAEEAPVGGIPPGQIYPHECEPDILARRLRDGGSMEDSPESIMAAEPRRPSRKKRGRGSVRYHRAATKESNKPRWPPQ